MGERRGRTEKERKQLSFRGKSENHILGGATSRIASALVRKAANSTPYGLKNAERKAMQLSTSKPKGMQLSNGKPKAMVNKAASSTRLQLAENKVNDLDSEIAR